MKVEIDGWAWIDVADLSVPQRQKVMFDLTIIPKKGMTYGDDDEVKDIYLYTEKGDKIGVARQYYNQFRKPHHEVVDNTSVGDSAIFNEEPIKFDGALRAEQQKAHDEITTKFKAGHLGGVVKAPTGWGKTVWACSVMASMEMPTLVIVHKEFLMNQWRERIQKFLPDAKIGHVQQDILDYKGRHVVLAMVHTLVGRQFDDEFYRYFGLVITDETHRIGASTWSTVPPKFPARHRLGISATPRRKDGAENVFLYHLGPVMFHATELRMKPKIRRVWTNFTIASTPNFNPNLAPRPLMVRFLCSSVLRNKQIIEQLIQAIQTGRKVMVLSERLKHLDLLEKMLHASWKPEYGKYPTSGKYVGGMDEGDLKISEQKTVIFATVQFASEGLDIPALDTLFLTTPMVDVEQAVGRILRPSEGKKDPIVVDFRDDRVSMFQKFGEARDRFYKKLGV